MSVVAYDGRTLAADCQATNVDMRTRVSKMLKTPRAVLAWVGDHERGLVLADWYCNGAKPEDWPAFQRTDKWCRLVAMTPTGLYEYEQEPFAQRVTDRHFACGSGRDYAIGAMAAGASAVRAVEIASQYNVYCGMGVEAYERNCIEDGQ